MKPLYKYNEYLKQHSYIVYNLPNVLLIDRTKRRLLRRYTFRYARNLLEKPRYIFGGYFIIPILQCSGKRYIISLTIGTKMLHAKHPSCHRTETWTGMHLPNMGLTNFGVKIWMKYGCVCVNNKDITITRSNHLLNGSQRWSFDESALKPDDFILFKWMLGIKPLSLLDR